MLSEIGWRLEGDDEPTLYVYDVITSQEYTDYDGETYGVSAQGMIDRLADYKGKEVTVRINSRGGDVFNGVAMYEALKNHDGGVKTIVDGQAASAASVVMLAGSERLISRAGIVMIHEPMVYFHGNRTEVRSQLEALDSLCESVTSLYLEHLDAKKDDIEKWMSDTKYFSSKEAIECGFATGFIGDTNTKKDSKDKTMQSEKKAPVMTGPDAQLALAVLRRRRRLSAV
jgi:ATP-dependent Clp protease protease subunit